MKSFELMPNDSHKSFYGKAIVFVYDDDTQILHSYGTRVIKRDAAGNLSRLWDGWSATTGRHVAAFCGLNKYAYFNLSRE